MSEENYESIEKELKKRPGSIVEPSLRTIGKDELSSNDISILHDLERRNQLVYQEDYVSEFLRCRNNILYFIHNYCHIGEVGNPRLYSPDMMNRKYRRVIKSINRYRRAILMASRQLGKSDLPQLKKIIIS